jgi:hypothetical protein
MLLRKSASRLNARTFQYDNSDFARRWNTFESSFTSLILHTLLAASGGDVGGESELLIAPLDASKHTPNPGGLRYLVRHHLRETFE